MAHIRVGRGGPAGKAHGGGTGIESRAREGARHASPWLVRLARFGLAAKGLVYLVIGGLATMAAMGSGGGTTDTRGAMGFIAGSPAGRGLLAAMGVGLLAYGFWALVAAALDSEHRGGDGKGIIVRLARAGRVIAYGALGVEAIRLFLTARGSDGNGADHWTGRVMAMPFGRWIIAAVGAGIALYAIYQWWRAASKDLGRRLRIPGGDGNAHWALKVARFGIAARGVVFLMIGWFLIQAALRFDPARAGGIGESLAALAGQPYGPVVLGVVALGMMAYGVWELVNARYREMSVG
jgi:hypothetical protein